MNADTLWSSILQAAIQGKLVPQDPNDESAPLLMGRILQSNAKNGKKAIRTRNKSQFSIIKENDQWMKKTDEGLQSVSDDYDFTIPDSWILVKLSDIVFQLTDGTHHSPKLYSTGTYRYVSAKNIRDFTFRFPVPEYVSEKDHREIFARCSPAYGDILLTKDGTVGEVCVNTLSEEFSLLSSVALIKLPGGLIDNHYFARMLQSPQIQSQLLSKKSGTALKRVTLDKIADVILPIPPLAEQKRIVAKLEEMKPLVESYGRYQTRLSELNTSIGPLLKKSILQAAIQGKLVPQDPNDGSANELMASIIKLYPSRNKQYTNRIVLRGDKWFELMGDIEKELDLAFSIPSSWSWVRIKQLGRIVGGGTPKTDKAEYWGGDINWITPADMKYVKGTYVSKGQKTITERGLAESSAQLMPAGSVVYSSRAPIGYVAIASNEICTNQGFKSIVPYVMELSEYLYYALQAFTPLIIKEASGTTFKEISGSDFGNILLPLPPLAEQHRIVLRIRQLNVILDNFSGKIA